MSNTITIGLNILLVEDDAENLELLCDTLPAQMADCALWWDPCQNFDEAVQRLRIRRYDLVVTDIYRNRENQKKGIHTEDEWSKRIIDEIHQQRFCPIVVFTDGPPPRTFDAEQPFVRFADKSVGNDQILARMEELLETGVPQLAQTIHEEIDQTAGSYLWTFLNRHWSDLESLAVPGIIERLIRRRTAIQLSRLRRADAADHVTEVDFVEGLEFYLYPSLTPSELRLGEILQGSKDQQFRVVLTPHCHLVRQPGDDLPRADYVLTGKTVPAEDIRAQYPLQGREERQRRSLGKYIQSPARTGRPDGRYWFLPSFLAIPELYCDFLQLESLSYREIQTNYQRIAVLDTPFAEALQSCFTRFYSAVGLPRLQPERYEHWITHDDPEREQS